MIFEEQFPVPRYTDVSKIGNSVISSLWQLRCHCNPDHNKFSSLSNTTVVTIFPKLCLWRRSLCLNLGGIGPEKLHRATLPKDVFERRASFSFLICLEAIKFVLLSFFYSFGDNLSKNFFRIRAQECKKSTSVDVRLSKTSLLKLPILKVNT